MKDRYTAVLSRVHTHSLTDSLALLYLCFDLLSVTKALTHFESCIQLARNVSDQVNEARHMENLARVKGYVEQGMEAVRLEVRWYGEGFRRETGEPCRVRV